MTFPSSPFPRTEFDGTPCSAYRVDRSMKSIGLSQCDQCDRCSSDACAIPYYRWEPRLGGFYYHDHFVHSPARDFPILRSSPLWQPTWTHHGMSYRDRVSGYENWFPPLQCGPNAFGDVRKKIIGVTTSNYRRKPTQLLRVFSSPACRCSTCLENTQTVELMVQSIAWQMAGWQDDEHRCWFTHASQEPCTCGKRWTDTDLVEWRDATDAEIRRWADRNRWFAQDDAIRGHNWSWNATDEMSERVDDVLFTYAGQPVRRSDIAESVPMSNGRLSVTLTTEAAIRVGSGGFQIGLGNA